MMSSWSLLLPVVASIVLLTTTTTANEEDNNPVPMPEIYAESKYFIEGETFSVNCTADYTSNTAITLIWSIPGPFSKVKNESNEFAVSADKDILYNNYTITNAGIEDNGIYSCTAYLLGKNKSAKFTKIYLKEPRIDMKTSRSGIVNVTGNIASCLVTVEEYPPATYEIYRDGVLATKPKLVNIVNRLHDRTFKFQINDVTVEDTGVYNIVAKNKYITRNLTFDVRKEGAPVVNFGANSVKKYLVGMTASFVCKVTAYPKPEVYWTFTDGNNKINLTGASQESTNVYTLYSYLKVPVHNSGNVTCLAKNIRGSHNDTTIVILNELPGGFGIENSDKTWYSEHDNVMLKCLASTYDFENVTWYKGEGEELGVSLVEYKTTKFSHVAKLKVADISVHQAGEYMCEATTHDGFTRNETITITVAVTKQPTISEPDDDLNQEVILHLPANLTCRANGVPPPEIKWYKDDVEIINGTDNIIITTTYENHTSAISRLNLEIMKEENAGEYECRANSPFSSVSKMYTLHMKERLPHKSMYLSIIGVIFLILIILVIYLAWKIKKEKQFRKELAAAGLLYFKEGVKKSINPDLGIDEQAELLPYDDKFEFPAEKLTLGKQLGAGAFGVVYKAEARGIVNAEQTTTVAVKTVKKNADNMYIKALASELKIMVHLGKHINIVNLLGACTKNVGKRELIVIVEYCKFGNIHNYLQKHREVFIDQLTDKSEKSLGKVNRGFSCSSGNSGMDSEYFGSNHTQQTEHTFLNTANTNKSCRKVSETGYVQPEWRSNYESDYSFDGRSPRPLCSRDLLAWAFQIARGMEYLASRKVLHGDLAARNVLLADDNIVKICDFGLARSIYKNDEYQKKENSPLPVKWLAIECMTDRIFSTQSDVWSFGIVLWEMFSLAKTPYPNISPSSLLQYLSEGHRLDKPAYADDKLYEMMKRCWEQKPTARPSFTDLQKLIGSFLEDNVRNHYVDLNEPYMDMNKKKEGEEDYLAMMSAPDYNNLVTPSPHHYVNDAKRFFPTTPTPSQTQYDDEGYLQMSPATRQTAYNLRPPNNKFDFDPRKMSPRVSDSQGSELTPMLTLNNLPRSGSESDHEGNASPYLNMCSRIDEEKSPVEDEVFDTRQHNAKNTQLNSVTNPTYITFAIDSEKKPKELNNYININVPNGLVK